MIYIIILLIVAAGIAWWVWRNPSQAKSFSTKVEDEWQSTEKKVSDAIKKDAAGR
ncbi:MAG: hypothetical protein ACYDHZ_08095 [Dehalococcoidia bacterium]